MNVLKRSLLASLFTMFCICSGASDLSTNNQFNLSFSNLMLEELYFHDKLSNLVLEYEHQVFNWLGVGAYLGKGFYSEWELELNEGLGRGRYSYGYAYSTHYGLNSKIHLFPLLQEKPIQRFDIYSSVKIGFIKMNSAPGDNIMPTRGNYFDFSLITGMTFFLSRKFGLSGEMGYRHFKYRKGFNLRHYGFMGLNARYGLSYRF